MSLWLFDSDKPALYDSGVIVDFADSNTIDSFSTQTCHTDTKNVNLMVPLRYLSNF